MKQILTILVLVIIAAGIKLHNLKHDPFDSWVGSYELAELSEVQIRTLTEDNLSPDSEEGYHGNVNIFRYGEYELIDFMVSGPPFHTVIGGTYKIESLNSKSIEFYFHDGWDNKGLGQLTRLSRDSYHLKLKTLPDNDSDSPFRNRGLVLMGEYSFRKTTSTPHLEANPWSFGRLTPEMRKGILASR